MLSFILMEVVLIKHFVAASSPFDIKVDTEGNIYVAPGSNQWSELQIYSRATKEMILSTNYGVYAGSYIDLVPGTQLIYTSTINFSQPSIDSIYFSNDGVAMFGRMVDKNDEK